MKTPMLARKYLGLATLAALQPLSSLAESLVETSSLPSETPRAPRAIALRVSDTPGPAPTSPVFVPPVNVGPPVLNFAFTKGPGIVALEGGTPAQQALAAQVVSGFQAAGALWQNALFTPITMSVTIDYQALGPGVLGQAGSDTVGMTLTQVKTALTTGASGANDILAVASLPSGSSYGMTRQNRAGTLITDNDGSGNNNTLDVNRANAKALGFLPANDPTEDTAITFSSNFTFDFDRSNGITAGQFDFVGVAAHEIGHGLGFVSGVDTVDFLSAPNGSGKTQDINGGTAGIGELDPFRVYSVLDVFRYTSVSVTRAGGYGAAPYFSLDTGTTAQGLFSTGRENGDGQQASHWKDNLGIGIMDPTLAPGELAMITMNDLRAFDAMGYTLVPEPATGATLLLGAMVLGLRRRRA